MSERFVPRPAQQRILEYTGGPMGISAVPGSGKTFTLSLLAAQLVERLAQAGRLDEREVLVVTFTNSAVENFRSRIGRFVREEKGLLAGVGYRVRTLHGLAHDIVRERPALVGLSEDFDIIDERTAAEIKRDAVVAYFRSHPDAFSYLILPDYLQNFRSIERYLLDDALEVANAVIRTAKDLRVEPHTLQAALRAQSGTWPLLEFGVRIYADYQRSLSVRGAVDFDDLIILALRALDADPDYLARLQDRWPYVLEDEAQDSSVLQEEMLRRLTASHGNWVRVGDPNQAINTTFTSADTRFLRRFIQQHPEQARTLPNSGRSALPIIELANWLSHWSRTAHPVLPPDMALTPPDIEPTPPGDPQPNPEPGNPAIHIYDRDLTPDQELEVIVRSLSRWLPDNPEWTVAVLVPDNNRGFQMAAALEAAGLPFDDSLLRADGATRAAAQALATVLAYIARPEAVAHLEKVWGEVWWPRRGVVLATQAQADGEAPAEALDARPATRLATRSAPMPEPVETFGRALRRVQEPEQLLFPAQTDWLDTLGWLDEYPGFREVVEAFRADLRRWTSAMILPVDELLLTLGNDLFHEPADLALTHRLAVLLARLAQENPGWRLPELAGELEGIAQNRRRILGFNEEGVGYEARPGQVTVATMHSAKGLEWDRVYLLSVNSYSFPSGGDEESYRGERWYVRDNLNLVAEAVAQLTQLHRGTLDEYVPGVASRQARLEIAAERLRLLYVGITRARRELIVTYNTGRNPERNPTQPALAFRALAEFMAHQAAH
ncbi:MAG: DNA helicase [Litorilinea sp.]|nr:MAG: DNA helicase [Litorilinea sp.]